MPTFSDLDLVDQVALLFFIGQNGLHELEADYIAVSYVKGHILLTWDLGAGKWYSVSKEMDQFTHQFTF